MKDKHHCGMENEEGFFFEITEKNLWIYEEPPHYNFVTHIEINYCPKCGKKMNE